MQPKTINILYWVFTVLFAGMMILSAVGGISPNAETLKFMHDTLGYPAYFVSLISIAKIAGAAAILIPGLKKIKEWAYAGLFFDLAGALVSVTAASNKFDPSSLFILLPVVLGILSYIFWNKKNRV
jgi:DoxX-like family